MLILKLLLIFSNINSVYNLPFHKSKLHFKGGHGSKYGDCTNPDNQYYIFQSRENKHYLNELNDGSNEWDFSCECIIGKIILRSKSHGQKMNFHVHKIDGELQFKKIEGELTAFINEEIQFTVHNIQPCEGILGFGYMQATFIFPRDLTLTGYWFDFCKYRKSFNISNNNKYQKLE